jgi:hypothetical protein
MMSKSNIGVFTLVPVLCVLTLFLLLSFVSVSVILAGSTVYESIAENMDQNYEKRVTLAYLTTKIRQNDRGIIGIEEVNGINMLAIRENFGEENLWAALFGEAVTYIYFDAGSNALREILLFDGDEFELSDGEFIISSQGFDINLTDRYIEISLTGGDGMLRTSRVTLRAAG